MSTPSGSRSEEVPRSSWKKSLQSCFQMTNFTPNADGEVSVMNTNYRIVPTNIWWVCYDPDPVRQMVSQKITIESNVIPYIKSTSYTNEDIRKLCTALLMCIPVTSTFKPRGADSYCPLSKQVQGWRVKYDLEGIYC